MQNSTGHGFWPNLIILQILIEQTDELLEQIEEMASLMLSKNEISTMLELDPDEFLEIMQDKAGKAYKRYQTGRMKTITQVRKSVFELAGNGSSPAQTEAMKIIRESKMEDI